MLDKDFLDGMDRLRATFGAQFYPAEKEKLIASRVKFMPRSGWLEVVDNLILAKRYAPTPVEIIEETKNWQRAHPSSFETVQHARPLECSDCFETGWLYFDADFGSSLMACHCREGAKISESVAVPRWEPRVSDRAFGWSIKPFPADKFKPSESELESIFKNAESNIVTWWKNERRAAVRFWEKKNEEWKSEAQA